jgi:hypothetical protein
MPDNWGPEWDEHWQKLLEERFKTTLEVVNPLTIKCPEEKVKPKYRWILDEDNNVKIVEDD